MGRNIKNRRRKVDVDSMAPADAENVGNELGKRITAITEKAAEEVNRLTQIYGIKAKVAIQLINEQTGETIT